jgi:NDP-sugar pyrophosphorylase family protein
MRAVIIAGGEGTRLRPLTLSVPKPVVPVVDRPFLRFQLDLLRAAGVADVVLSLGYRPERIQAAFPGGAAAGLRLHYVVEDTPLGTGGAVKNAEGLLDGETVVLNGDVLTDLDLAGVVAEHRRQGAAATLVLTPVPNPAAYGLVELDREGNVTRFLEKPSPDQITTDTINAGIYILDTRLLALMPPAVNHSIERAFFPTLLARRERVRAHVHRGYWIDIGTPEKYRQVHRDILEERLAVPLDGRPLRGGHVHATAEVDDGARLAGPFYVGPGCRVAAGAEIRPGTVLTAGVTVEARARVSDTIAWAGTQIGAEAEIDGALLGTAVRVGRFARVGPGAVLGEATVLTDYSRS